MTLIDFGPEAGVIVTDYAVRLLDERVAVAIPALPVKAAPGSTVRGLGAARYRAVLHV
jgi:hypothetical protein